MSGADRWMPLYVSDYLGDTMGLSTLQHGAYILLLMHYWRHGPLPDDQAELAAIARADTRTWRTIWPKLCKFFTANGDGTLHQKRMDWERRRWSEISDKRRTAGKAGAVARYQPHPSNGSGKPIANAMANAKQTNGKCHAVATDFAIPPLPLQENLNSSNKEYITPREGKPPISEQNLASNSPADGAAHPDRPAADHTRSSDAFLDDPSEDDALPKADPTKIKRSLAAVTYSLRKFAPGPGIKPDKTRNEQVEVLEHGEPLPPDERPRRGPQPPERTVAEQLAALGFPRDFEARAE